jgi:hypothetical protein
MMTDKDLKDCLDRVGLLDERGQILYCGIDLLSPKAEENKPKHSFYFVGFNPRKDGTNPVLRDVPEGRRKWSAYTQQCWTCGLDSRCVKHGRKIHQTRVLQIMCELNLKPEKTFATNLTFVESNGAADIYSEDLFNRCWTLHKKMLSEVRPDYIICLGNDGAKTKSAFSLLRKNKATKITDAEPAGTSSGTFKKFTGTFELEDGSRELTVIGVRHPSYQVNPEGLRQFIGI